MFVFRLASGRERERERLANSYCFRFTYSAPSWMNTRVLSFCSFHLIPFELAAEGSWALFSLSRGVARLVDWRPQRALRRRSSSRKKSGQVAGGRNHHFPQVCPNFGPLRSEKCASRRPPSGLNRWTQLQARAAIMICSKIIIIVYFCSAQIAARPEVAG